MVEFTEIPSEITHLVTGIGGELNTQYVAMDDVN